MTKAVNQKEPVSKIDFRLFSINPAGASISKRTSELSDQLLDRIGHPKMLQFSKAISSGE